MTMKHVVLGVLVGLCCMSLAYAQKGDDMKKSTPSPPKVTPEYLLAHGFKQATDVPNLFVAEHVRLADVAGTIGFRLSDLWPADNAQRPYEVLTVETRGTYVIVRPEFQDSKGRFVQNPIDDRNPIDNPNTLCQVHVSFQGPKREYLKTDSSPRMRIKAVLVPEDHSEPLQVDFDLSATGKKPVAIWRSNFHVHLTGGSISPGTLFGFSFPKGAPYKIIVSPGKPTVFRIRVVVADLVGSLSPGEYALRIRIGEIKSREPQRFDYEWEGQEHWSNEYKFVVK